MSRLLGHPLSYICIRKLNVELKPIKVMDGLFFLYVLTVVMSIMVSALFEENEVKEAE